MRHSVSPQYRPAVKICFVLVDYEKWGRTDGRTDDTSENSDQYRPCVGRPSGSIEKGGNDFLAANQVFLIAGVFPCLSDPKRGCYGSLECTKVVLNQDCLSCLKPSAQVTTPLSS